MLEIKNISKTYRTADLKQTALDDVSLNFRNCEFVSILGPSGSGKTTLLNIIGGLDRYDSGDLIINSISTKKYKSKDWDSYRNHTVGFVFQSYNLIPHQTILSNVELALTISGVSKKERRKRALDALEQVGLREQSHKKPNQMSGGQMQRVAVARALVNNPDILLADEPTGALDSETSLQVMDLLSTIAKDRLVVMVTHNPELAENYSTRIVKLKDGKIIDDSNPYKITKASKIQKYKNLGKSSMSITTAFGLSLNNLLTKKGRTILTAFAGSIGIIGIALILSLSNGFQKYIDKVQEDALTAYPLTIEKETTNTTAILLSAVSKNKDDDVEKGKIKETKNLETMLSSVGKNDIKSFKKYIEDNQTKIDKMTTNVDYTYSVTPNIYGKDLNNKIIRMNPSSVFDTLMSGMGGSQNMGMFAQIVDDNEMLKNKYSVIEGRIPESYNEVVIILPDENHISDLLLYALGLKDASNVDNMINKIYAGEKIEKSKETKVFTPTDLMQVEMKLINTTDLYKYNADYNIYEDMSENEEYLKDVYNKSLNIKIVGILKPKDESGTSSLAAGVGYRGDMIKYLINQAKNTEIVKKQLSNKNKNVLNGKDFSDNSDDAGLNFEELITIDTEMLSSAFNVKIDEAYIQELTSDYMGEIGEAITADTTDAKTLFLTNLSEITNNLLNDYIKNNHLEGMDSIATIKLAEVDSIVDSYFQSNDVVTRLQEMEDKYVIPKDTYDAVYKELIKSVIKVYVSMASTSEDEEKIAPIATQAVEQIVTSMTTNEQIPAMADEFSKKMVEATMQKTILTKVGELTGKLMGTMANAFNVDQNKIAGAFKFNLTEDDIKRIFKSMSNTTKTDANQNLLKLGYQDIDEPSTISFYFKDFNAKDDFIKFLKDYNKKMKKINKEKVIEYTDITGLMISSVKVIVDSVSYVLIAFVSISLIVSSIMIGIITYISVLERTKEIGILRAIGASKKNIASIFNAETFIVGFLAGLIGVGVSLLLLIPINTVIHTLTKNENITAILPFAGGITLIILSTVLTLIGGLIPSRKASKQDPVLALRSE